MKMHEASPRHEWMHARVEAYVDGDLPTAECDAFEHLLDASPYWQTQVQHARRIRDALHALPELACPPQVTDAVLGETRRRTHDLPHTNGWTRIQRALSLEGLTGWKPALAGLTLVLVVVASLFSLDREQVPLTNDYTSSEIEQAEAEAKWALAYVAQVSQQTGSTVEETVFEENVAVPMRRALRPLSNVDTAPTHSN